MNNKKKIIIAAVAVVVCAIMFAFAMKVQSSYADKVTNQQVSSSTIEQKSNDIVKQETTEEKTTEKKSEDINKEEKIEKKTTKEKSDDITMQKETKEKTEDKSNKENKSDTKIKENKNTSNKKETENNVKSNDSLSNSTNNAVSKSSKTTEGSKNVVPNEEPTFIFIDAVNGNRVILQKYVDMEGENVGYITCKTLDEAKIKYRATGSYSTIYFSAIDGLEEKKAGRLSGWCYYVKKKGDTKFVKPNVGAGQYIYQKGDIVMWKYVLDGIYGDE